MSQRAFLIRMAVIGALILLAASSVGAIFGFFIAIAIAFFLAPLAWAINLATGIPFETVATAVGVIYALAALAVGVTAALLWRAGDFDRARRVASRFAILIALPLIGWLSMNAMMRAWP